MRVNPFKQCLVLVCDVLQTILYFTRRQFASEKVMLILRRDGGVYMVLVIKYKVQHYTEMEE